MAQKILIPLDGSTLGETALHYVEQGISKLEPKQKPEIILLHVINLEPHLVSTSFSMEYPYSPKEVEQIKKAALDYLHKTANILQAKGFEVDYKLLQGNVADEIIRAEREIQADMVAMSTHGRSGLSRLALGSVAEKVLRTGVLPVLIVRASEELGNA